MYMYMRDMHANTVMWIPHYTCMSFIFLLSFLGEKLTDDEVDALLQGVEDSQGQVNYEGWSALNCRVRVHIY